MANKCLIVDGNSLMYRAFFALPPMDSGGVPTNAVHGFLLMLLKAVEEYKPEYCVVAFDEKAPTFRHSMYEDYKANRPKMPDELVPQFDIIKELLSSMNIGIVSLMGYEADDLLGTISSRLSNKGYKSGLLTGDRDALQLVNENVSLLFTKKGISEIIPYTPEKVEEDYGVSPEQVTDWKGLMGDSSDNIPGIPGVGEKTAVKLLKQYGTMENVLSDADNIKGKLGERIRDNMDKARISKVLATIHTDVPIDIELDNWRTDNMGAGIDTLKKYRLNSIINRLQSLEGVEIPKEAVEKPIEWVDISGDYENALSVFDNSPIAIHIGEEYISLSQENINLRIALASGQISLFEKAEGIGLSEALTNIMPHIKQKLILHDSKAFYHMLNMRQINIPKTHWDTKLSAYLINPQEKSYALGAFAVENSAGVYKLYIKHKEELKRLFMSKLYTDIELPLANVLFDMELAGFKVDTDVLKELGKEYSYDSDRLSEEIISSLGVGEFNLNSPKQLSEVLFDKLKLPARKKTSGGTYSTDAATLESLIDYHPAIRNILKYRQVSKLSGTYIEPMLKNVDSKNRIHTTFDQTATATGRISSNDPNLQTIPVRTELGREIRKAFIAKEGHVLIDGDYSQIELRILAHMSGDENMRLAFINGEDIHTQTASRVYGVPICDVTSDMRSSSKAINFGIVYGISDFGLAQNIGTTRKQAAEFIDSYLSHYPGVRDFMENAKKFGYDNCYAVTLYGRRRPLPELKSRNYHTRSFGERVAINTPIQGTAADIIKAAMVKVSSELKRLKLGARLILQVHDELLIECPIEEEKEVTELLKSCMENIIELSVPLICDVNAGKSWYETK
ncbi:MAG: DNA polymerase I [Christensenellales bacterium]|jgi:DNA polymerase-1